VHLWNEMLGLSPADRYVVLNPFFHVFGTKYGWLCALLAGVTAYPLAVFDPRSLMDLIEREQITFVPGQPTIFASLLALPDLERYDRSHLRLAVVGSTAIPPQLVRDMHDVLGFRHVVSGYGLTETCGEVTLCRFDDDIETVAHTVGRPLDGVEVRVVDAEDAAVPAGSDGEILVRGFNVMRGYLGEPEATAAVLDPDGWLRTGDWGHLDEAGSLSITGRVKDIVIVGGFNVAPPEVESALLLHPGIRDAAVIGVPDERLGEVTAAFIVGEDGASPTQDEVVAWCRERLANFKVPRAVWFVSALPYNAIGKIQKNELRDRAAAGDTSW
jgi:acyl-CoA synthetase (AMP-forming)/AMP-acid ligase II